MHTRTKLRIDTYYDLTCDDCARSWSTDFNGSEQRMGSGGMGMAQNRAELDRLARRTGWRCLGGRTLCPECWKREKGEETP